MIENNKTADHPSLTDFAQALDFLQISATRIPKTPYNDTALDILISGLSLIQTHFETHILHHSIKD